MYFLTVFVGSFWVDYCHHCFSRFHFLSSCLFVDRVRFYFVCFSLEYDVSSILFSSCLLYNYCNHGNHSYILKGLGFALFCLNLSLE